MSTFVGFSTSASSTTVSAPAPGGVALNDQLVIYIVGSTTAITSFTATGWTAATPTSGQNCTTGFLYKTANSSDVTLSGASGSYTITCSSSVRMAGVIGTLGQGVLDPVPTVAGQLIGASATSFTPVLGPTSTHNNNQIIFFGSARVAANPAPSITVDVGYTSATGTGLTSGEVSSTATGATVSAYVATKTQTTAGAVPNGTVTWNQSSDGGGMLITVTRPGAKVRHVGAALGHGTAGDESTTTFLGNVGAGRLKILHAFYGTNVPASVAAAPNVATDVTLAASAGVYRVWLDFELTHYGVNGTYGSGGTPAAGAVTDAAKLDTFIGQCQAAGIDVRVILWHEPFDKFNTQGTQALCNLDYTNSIGYYGAVLRKYGLPVSFDPSNYSADHDTRFPLVIGSAATPGLGWAACALGYIDEVHTDIYPNEKNTSSTPAGSGIQGTYDACATLADHFGLPLGILELGPAPATAVNIHWNDTDVQTFLQYTINYLATRNSAGKPISDIVMWATNDNATQAGMYLSGGWSAGTIAKYQTLFDTYDSGNYGGSGVATSVTGIESDISVDAPAGTVTATVSPTTVGGSTSRITVAATAGLAIPITNSPFMLPKPIVYPLSGFSITISSLSSAFWSEWNAAQTISSTLVSQWNDVTFPVSSQAPMAWNSTLRIASLSPLTNRGGLCSPVVHPIVWYYNPSGIQWDDDARSHAMVKSSWKTSTTLAKKQKIRWKTNTIIHSSKSSAWKIRGRVYVPGNQSFNFYNGILQNVVHPIDFGTTVNVPAIAWNAAFRVKKRRTSRWNTLLTSGSSKRVTWNTQAQHVFKQIGSAWFITQRVNVKASSKWNTAQRTHRNRKVRWNTNFAVVTQKGSNWNFLDKVHVIRALTTEYSLATSVVHPVSYYKSVIAEFQWNIAQRISGA